MPQLQMQSQSSPVVVVVVPSHGVVAKGIPLPRLVLAKGIPLPRLALTKGIQLQDFIMYIKKLCFFIFCSSCCWTCRQ